MTAKQKQCLLAYLGYYNPEDIDGKWGDLSWTATEAFQKAYGLKADGIFGANTKAKILSVIASDEHPVQNDSLDSWDDIKHFKRSEFKCKCGKCGGFPVEPSKELVSVLEKIRNYFGKPVTVNSGIRCATHNKNVGGASMSQHLKGTAADIVVHDISPERVAMYAETLLPKTGGIGRYKTFTHIDVRSVKSRWNG